MRLALGIALLTIGGCSSAGNVGQAIPSVGAEITLKGVRLDVDEANIKLLLTPAELRSLADALETQQGS